MECSLLSSTQYPLSALQKCEVSVLLFAGVIRHGLEKPNSSHREEEAPRRLRVDAALEKIRPTCPPMYAHDSSAASPVFERGGRTGLRPGVVDV
jgi:hypothetical protein